MQPKKYNKYKYLTKAEQGFIAGVMSSMGTFDTARIIRYIKQGQLVGYRYRLQSRPKSDIIAQLGEMLNIKPADGSDRGLGLSIAGEDLDDLMDLIGPYMNKKRYDHYREIKAWADKTKFNLIDRGWEYRDDVLTGPARNIYRGIDFTAIDEYLAYDKEDRHKVKERIQELQKGLRDSVR